jgi:hypothetical protein
MMKIALAIALAAALSAWYYADQDARRLRVQLDQHRAVLAACVRAADAQARATEVCESAMEKMLRDLGLDR